MILAKTEKIDPVNDEQAVDINQIAKRLDMLDQRLDNIDSVVSAVVERVMTQPVTLQITCSNCGQNLEIAIIGTEKPRR